MKQHESTHGFDTMLDALGTRERRYLLSQLLVSNPRDEEWLVDQLETDADEQDLLARIRHTDLPKLDQMEFITWDDEEGTIVKGPRFDEIRPILQLMVDHEDELPDGWL